jgi:hypothetical protein
MADGAQQKARGRQASPDQQAQLADLNQRVQIAQREEMARQAREVRPCLLYEINCTFQTLSHIVVKIRCTGVQEPSEGRCSFFAAAETKCCGHACSL